MFNKFVKGYYPIRGEYKHLFYFIFKNKFILLLLLIILKLNTYTNLSIFNSFKF